MNNSPFLFESGKRMRYTLVCMGKANWCQDCEASSFVHVQSWIDDFSDALWPHLERWRWVQLLGDKIDRWSIAILCACGCMRYERVASYDSIALRLALFIQSARAQGIDVEVAKGPWGYTSFIRFTLHGKTYHANGFPQLGEHSLTWDIDDKKEAKIFLEKTGFCVPKGKSFWIWQKRAAMRYAKIVGFPLVVKPRNGSVARHVTTNIRTEDELVKAIRHAISYAPSFIVEEYKEKGYVHRVTVIDESAIFCARQIPAHIIGDGKHTLRECVEIKNKRREEEKKSLYHPISIDNTVVAFVSSQGKSLEDVVPEGEIVYLRRDPFVRFGGDIEEMTRKVHSDNKDLFLSIARAIKTRMVGMDIIMEDVARSYREQEWSVLELNSFPCIDIHAQPSMGEPCNIAGVLVEAVKKYYGTLHRD